MTALLCFVFFLSGLSALIFEVAWFYLAGLTLGNTVWTVSIVSAAFMLGLAAGNAAAFLKGRAVVSPVRLFALLQVVIAVSGFGCVLVFPRLAALFVPLYRSLQHSAYLLNLFRLIVSFLILAIPCVCMGMTLPLLVNALYLRSKNYAGALGLLYGWNTLGAVAGVLAAEFILIRVAGIQGTGLIAACLNLTAAVIAFAFSAQLKEQRVPVVREALRVPRLSGRVQRILFAGFLSGGILLALEVVWFRFFSLFFNALRMNFSIMLACVLAGIALGSLNAARWFRKTPDAHTFIALPVALCGMLVSALYTSFYRVLAFLFNSIGTGTLSVWMSSLFMILPVSFLSGMIFTMLARQLADNFENKLQATGIFTMANTAGSMCGALLAGMVLIPRLGMERSFLALGLAYGVLLLLVARRAHIRVSRSSVFSHYLVIAGYLLFMLLFGWGMMRNYYSKVPLLPFLEEGIRRVAFEEGAAETVQCLQADLLNRPYYHYLVTNHHSMSSTTSFGRRYMKYFAWFALAVHPQPKDILVVSYGLGNTAAAFTDDHSVGQIDVVDVSSAILETSRLVYAAPRADPLNDPRVKTHIEDGRFFLLVSDKKYDVITGEPPPPKNQGVLSLYTEEYFRLIYERLKEPGIVTYWLPVSHLKPAETRSIVRAFCNVFDNCSLWAALPYEWMLVGTRGFTGPSDVRHFSRLWDDPVNRSRMHRLGFFVPDEFGSLFIVDGDRLRQWLGQAKPLADNYPARISQELLDERFIDPAYLELLDARGSFENFKQSRVIARIWPAPLRERAEQFFPSRDFVFQVLGGYEGLDMLTRLHRCLSYSYFKMFLPWALESDPDAQAILAEAINRGEAFGIDEAGIHLAARAVMQGDYTLAESYYGQLAERWHERSDELYGMRFYLLYRAQEIQKAGELAKEYIAVSEYGVKEREEKVKQFFAWLASNLL